MVHTYYVIRVVLFSTFQTFLAAVPYIVPYVRACVLASCRCNCSGTELMLDLPELLAVVRVQYSVHTVIVYITLFFEMESSVRHSDLQIERDQRRSGRESERDSDPARLMVLSSQ
jgi:hypothetical protein